ncbi:lysoplasmalogenase [Hyphococcus sp. DH-69]|uniref:lysoplasmalogenase n=1 Tax=Hyphococcus formosus TaxID=3143534 RepID=UPI00398AC055
MVQNLLIISCVIFVSLLLVAEYRASVGLVSGYLKWLSKPAASLVFVLLALAGGALETSYGIWILAGLVLCMAGDIFLIPNAEKAFLAGMAAFALGHLAYIGAFLGTGPEISGLFLIGSAGMTAMAILALRWLWPTLAAFRAPVAAYSAIIAIMVATSFMASPGNSSAPNLTVIAGAIGFAVSDLAVAREKFVTQKFFNKLWGLPLYYGAQLLLASSV